MTKHQRGGLSFGAVILAALVPKCPFCIAAWLTALGVGGAVSLAIAPFVKPSIYVLVALTLAISVRGLLGRSRMKTGF